MLRGLGIGRRQDHSQWSQLAYWITLGQFIRHGVEYTQNIRPGILHISPELLGGLAAKQSSGFAKQIHCSLPLTQYICGSSPTHPSIVTAGNF